MFPLETQLSKVQQQVLTLLASGRTINEAAVAAGVHRNTIANWRRSSETFRNDWNTMQYEQAMHWRDQLQSLAPIALDALQTLLTDPKTPPSVRLRAAVAVLEKATVPAPAQPDLHKSAQPAPKGLAYPLESMASPPSPEAGPMLHPEAAPTSAQPCTTPTSASDINMPCDLETDQDLEQFLAQLTSPPFRIPPETRR